MATSVFLSSSSIFTPAGGTQTINGAVTATGAITSGGSITMTGSGVGAEVRQLSALLANSTTGRIDINNTSRTIGSSLKVDALPTVTAGGGTSPAVTAGSTPFAGSVNVGSGAPGATITVTFGGTAFPSAPFVVCMNLTTGLAVKAAATTTTLVITPATGNFGASDVIAWHCISSK